MNIDTSQGWSLSRLSVRSDVRGNLVAIEGGRDAPFVINRVYYLYGLSPETERGFHAHQKLQQLAIAVSGSCTFVLDDGKVREEIRLERPDVALYIGAMTWREMRDFSPDCVVLVLASEFFDETDYIREHGEFLRQVEVMGSR
jgi:hypothetical protein